MTKNHSILSYMEKKVADDLLAALICYAPDGSAQAQVVSFFGDMQQAGCTNEEMVRSLSGALNDGLRTGNWPWVIDAIGRY